MTKVANTSVQKFNKVIAQAGDSVSKVAVQKALRNLGDALSKAERKTLDGLLKKDVLTPAARQTVKAFIATHAGGPAEGPVSLTTVKEVKALLQRNEGLRNDLFDTAFGAVRSKSSSVVVSDVHKRRDGGFDVELQLVHWRTRAVMNDATVGLSAKGKVEGKNGGPSTEAVGEEDGGGRVTTAALGEEGGVVRSTQAVGEEDGGPGRGGRVTTAALGEEGGGFGSTEAVGEEDGGRGRGGRVTTAALGEEGGGFGSTEAVGEEDGGRGRGRGGASTEAVGEEN